MSDKNLYIIAGCNGAGKTTASFTILPQIIECREFVNADEIARGISPFRPEGAAVEAGRIMLQRMDALMAAGETFAFETTLAAKRVINPGYSEPSGRATVFGCFSSGFKV